jgi:hypothetical protein
MWKNGRAYVRLADGTWQRRNRYVMEQTLGRPLLPSEIVHHKDSDPANDAPDNLEVYESHHDHLMKHHYWSREDALAALQAAIDAIGHVPTASEYRQRCDQPTTKVFYRLFGSWLGALTALGRADEYRPRSSNQFIRKRQ